MYRVPFLRSRSFKFRDLRPTNSAAACLWTRSLRVWPQDNRSSPNSSSANRSSASAKLPSPTIRDDEDPLHTGNPQSPPPAADPPKPKTPIQTIVESCPPPPDIPEESSQPTSQGLGELIMGAFGPSPPINPVPPNVNRPYTSALAALLTVGDQTFAASKGGFTVALTPVLPGSAPVTVAGTPVSLSPSGEIFIDVAARP